MEHTGKLSKAQWIRSQIVNNPNISYDEVKSRFQEEKKKKNIDGSIKRHDYYCAKYQISNRWGVRWNRIPRLSDGKIDKKKLLKILLRKYSNHSFGVIRALFDYCGVHISEDEVERYKQELINSGEYSDKKQTNTRARFTRTVRASKRRKSDNNETIQFDTIRKLASLADEAGGLEILKKAINLLEEIKSSV